MRPPADGGEEQAAEGKREPAVVEVHVGALDAASTRQLRSLLQDLTSRPSVHVVVDLTGLDDRHELTLFALLVEAGRVVRDGGGSVTAVAPPRRLAQQLRAAQIAVGRPFPDAERLELTVGRPGRPG